MMSFLASHPSRKQSGQFLDRFFHRGLEALIVPQLDFSQEQPGRSFAGGSRHEQLFGRLRAAGQGLRQLDFEPMRAVRRAFDQFSSAGGELFR